MIEIVRAEQGDIPRILSIIADAKAYMAEQGFSQWTEDYPDEQMFRLDIELERGFVIKLEQNIVGVAALSYKQEEGYSTIDGQWLSHQPYAVVHRMAISKEARGTDAALRLLQSMELRCRVRGINSIRTDTHSLNKPMQGLLKKAGYSYCGVVTYPMEQIPTGDPTRLAYEKILTDGCACKGE
ncbi:MAG: GNAT family N-acetyltransferase [Eubacteriales bacterium]|nr:GNAT family N-acetyltransferase [Eubacteriales bacterium]